MAKYIKLPLTVEYVENGGYDSGSSSYWILDASGEMVAGVDVKDHVANKEYFEADDKWDILNRRNEKAEAYANLFVLACNSHYEMLAACKEALKFCESEKDYGDWRQREDNLAELLLKAVYKARGEG